jgi:hypothetical protein
MNLSWAGVRASAKSFACTVAGHVRPGLGPVAADAGLVAVLLRAPGDVAYGADGDGGGRVAELAGEACPELLLDVCGEG